MPAAIRPAAARRTAFLGFDTFATAAVLELAAIRAAAPIDERRLTRFPRCRKPADAFRVDVVALGEIDDELLHAALDRAVIHRFDDRQRTVIDVAANFQHVAAKTD